MAVMNKEQWKLYNRTVSLLIQLAKRNNDTFKYWFRHEADPNLGTAICICNICNIQLTSHVEPVRYHGLQHLKDKNLLPFI